MITDKEFKRRRNAIKEKDDVEIQDKEQLLYYEVFRKKFGKPKDVFPEIERWSSMSQMSELHQNQRFNSAKYAELTLSNLFHFFKFSNISL